MKIAQYFFTTFLSPFFCSLLIRFSGELSSSFGFFFLFQNFFLFRLIDFTSNLMHHWNFPLHIQQFMWLHPNKKKKTTQINSDFSALNFLSNFYSRFSFNTKSTFSCNFQHFQWRFFLYNCDFCVSNFFSGLLSAFRYGDLERTDDRKIFVFCFRKISYWNCFFPFQSKLSFFLLPRNFQSAACLNNWKF